MNRSQRAKIKALHNAQNIAKSNKNASITEFGRGTDWGNLLKCRSRIEKNVRNEIRDYKVAIRNSKEAVTA